MVASLAERLVRRGHEIVVATSADPRRREDHHNGVRIVGFGITGNASRGMRGDLRRYRRWLLDEPCDVMMNYAAQVWPTDAALDLLDQLPCARVLATCGFSGLHGARRLLYWRYYRRMRARAGLYHAFVYHACSGADVSFGQRFGPSVQVVIPNGAEASEFDGPRGEFRRRWGVGARRLLLHVGNHYRLKGHRDLFALMDALGPRAGDLTLVMVGDDPGGRTSCWQACVRAAAARSNVMLLSGLAREEVVAAFRDADLVLLPSRFEVAPLVLVEAMAAGVPFVTYDVGNARELAGGVVTTGISGLIEATESLLNDEDRRLALGAQGRQAQRHHLEWDRITDRYEALFAALTEPKGSGQA